MPFNGVMDTGEVWAYRERPRALGEPVHRVEIVKHGNRNVMIQVRRLDGDDEASRSGPARRRCCARGARLTAASATSSG
jgi:hypothetical protein